MSDNLPAVHMDEAENKLALMSSNQLGVFTTINAETEEGKLDVFDALSNAENIDDAEMIGKPFKLKNFIIQTVEVTDTQTGEDRPTLRTILITDEGKAYASTSEGLFNSIRNLMGIVGHPSTWANPLPVVVKRVKGRSGFYFYTLSLSRG